MQAYQAVFSRPENLARVEEARQAIARAGGRVEIVSQGKTGMYVVLLYLPPGQAPEQLLPGLPFYLLSS